MPHLQISVESRRTLRVDVGGVFVVKHVVEVGNLALGVGDDGELQVGARHLVDILDPLVVRIDVVGALVCVVSNVIRPRMSSCLSSYQTDELDTASGKLGLELGKCTELGGANGGEVILSKSRLV